MDILDAPLDAQWVYLVTGGLSSLTLSDFDSLTTQRRINLLTWVKALEKKNAEYLESVKVNTSPK